MTRKDFELIARALAETREGVASPEQKRGVEMAARVLGTYLRDTNPRFDRGRFVRACGVEE